jgi:hypothetical protein
LPYSPECVEANFSEVRMQNPLPALPEGKEFGERLKSWLAEPVTSESLTIFGSYRLF